MKTLKNSNGFSALHILLTVIILGIVGFIGWYVWNVNNKSDDTIEQSALNTQNELANSDKEGNETNVADNRATFDCRGIFTLKYSASLIATTTSSDPAQCLVSNVEQDKLTPTGQLPPDELGLFFSANKTTFSTSEQFLNDAITRSQEDSALELKSKETLQLDNGKTATLAIVYGGRPNLHDFYYFVYLKGDTIIFTTSLPVKTDYKEAAIQIFKSIE